MFSRCFGGNITSDNISPKHLLNIKRLAYELRPASTHSSPTTTQSAPAAPAVLPKVAEPAAPAGLDTASMAKQVAAVTGSAIAPPAAVADSGAVVTFVCEEDVRQAIRLGRKIVIGERTIITPSARDLANEQKVFVLQSWPR